MEDYSNDLSLQLQAAAVAGGSLTVAAVTVLLKAWPPYVFAGAWALTGVAISSWSAEETLLWSTAAAGLLITGVASSIGVRRLLLASASDANTPRAARRPSAVA